MKEKGKSRVVLYGNSYDRKYRGVHCSGGDTQYYLIDLGWYIAQSETDYPSKEVATVRRISQRQREKETQKFEELMNLKEEDLSKEKWIHHTQPGQNWEQPSDARFAYFERAEIWDEDKAKNFLEEAQLIRFGKVVE